MDIKDLNRSQFLLLLLLIMFVSSITTAIVTVTLMDQSPRASVANTIDRVIERVIPGATTTIVKIVKEDSSTTEGAQVVKAMEIAAPSIIKIGQKTDKGSEGLGTGFVVRDGLAVTALKNLPEAVSQVIVVKGGLSVDGEVVSRDVDKNIAFIKFTATSSLPVASFAFNKDLPTSGETSIALAYADNGNPEIMTGIITGVIGTNSTTTDNTSVNVIRTGSVIGDNIGGPVLSLNGQLIGIGISRGYVLSASALRSLIDQVK